MPPKRRPKGLPPPSQPSRASQAYFSATCDRSSNLHGGISREARPDSHHLFVSSSSEALRNTQGYAIDFSSESSACHGEAARGVSFDGLRPTIASSVQAPLDPADLAEFTAQESAVAFGDIITSDGGNDITLAMDMKTDGTLGCAYFSGDNGTLFLFSGSGQRRHGVG